MSIFTSIAVSPSGTTLLNALQVTTSAGTVLNEGVTIVDSANPANVCSVLASGAQLIEPGGVNSQPVTGTITANQATAANFNATVVGPAASGATATGNPIRNGAVFNTTQPTVTTGQIVDLQTTNRGGLIVATGTDAFTAAITSSSAQTITAVQATPANLTATVSQGATAWVDNLTQVAGTALGATAVVNFGSAPAAVVVPAVNTALVNIGTTAVGTAAAGVQKVGVVGNANGVFDSATAASVPANALAAGGRAATANPTAVTNGQMVNILTDKMGRISVVQAHVRDLVSPQTTTIASSSAETTVVTAGGAGIFNDITSLTITNASATAFNATLKDATAGTTRAIYDIAANGGITINFNPPLPQAAAANNWTITLSVATITVHINIVYVKNL